MTHTPLSLPAIDGIHGHTIVLNEAFEDFAHRFSHLPGTVVLLSGGDLDCARYHILGAKPWLTFSGRHQDLVLATGKSASQFQADPFAVLQTLIKTYSTHQAPIGVMCPAMPIYAGLLGYLSYDLKDCVEELPRTSMDQSGLPHILMFAHSILVVHDKLENVTKLFITRIKERDNEQSPNPLDFFNAIVNGKTTAQEKADIVTGPLISNFRQDAYIQNIKTILAYIASGHVYQVNMSQRFEADFRGDAYGLFRTYYRLNPAPFFAFINAGDHQIVSTSPERFLFQVKNQVETRPIKGTRPRGKTPEEDLRMKEKLSTSHKDAAELSMIVDLMRNDMGKVCVGGSVFVDQHKRVEAYQNVYHLVSVVKGTLDPRHDAVDLIRATFPGGSITGCPKIRAMEIIDELEPDRRHIYTGSIGYISFHDTMDLSIVIRTATILNNKISFSVGGGIVFDSDPKKEFEETLHKGQTLMSAFHTNEPSFPAREVVWQNGRLVPAEDAGIPIGDLGVQYGFGFFETLLARQGVAKQLSAHIARFNNTWHQLFGDPPPDLTWDIIIGQVLFANGLDRQTAAVKIMATKGSRDLPPYNHCIVVTARPYVHRLEGKPDPGLHLAIYPQPRQTPLANHKTLNYLYYYLAGQWAKHHGKDEALVLNPNGTVSETNTAGLIVIKDSSAVIPESPAVLPGTMQKFIMDLLGKWGYGLTRREILPEDLFFYDDVLAANALMGAVPILSVDGKSLPRPSNLWKRINTEVF